MKTMDHVDQMIRSALESEDAAVLHQLAEPGVYDGVTELFRGRLRWYGAMFLFMILLFSVLAVLCAVRFVTAGESTQLIRWGAGFFLCFGAVLGGKTWYWMQLERLAMTREIKRVQLLVAQLAVDLRERG